METDWALPNRHIYTVSELTQNIKEFLEDAFPFVWISGEVSNLRQPGSGHLYFTLKDTQAQIDAVVFRGQSRSLKFDLRDGMAVIAMGRVNVYVSRGTYQIIVEYIEPGGLGTLQLAFEQLKAKLSSEGFFDESRKKYSELKNNIDYVEKVLKEGAEKAKKVAYKTLKEVRDAVGL